MAEAWKYGSQFAGNLLILRWTGYRRSLIGKALGSMRGCKMDKI